MKMRDAYKKFIAKFFDNAHAKMESYSPENLTLLAFRVGFWDGLRHRTGSNEVLKSLKRIEKAIKSVKS